MLEKLKKIAVLSLISILIGDVFFPRHVNANPALILRGIGMVTFRGIRAAGPALVAAGRYGSILGAGVLGAIGATAIEPIKDVAITAFATAKNGRIQNPRKIGVFNFNHCKGVGIRMRALGCTYDGLNMIYSPLAYAVGTVTVATQEWVEGLV